MKDRISTQKVMPKNKEALKRYRIIHSLLRRGYKYKTSEIVERCNDLGIPVKQRTIQNDLKDLAESTELGFYLPIKIDTRTKTYYYSEIPSNFFPVLDLEKDEIIALLFYNTIINQYREYPIFSEISNAVKKVIDNSNIAPHMKELFQEKRLLDTEVHPPVNGVEFIPEILEAIQNRRIIQLVYTKFSGTTKSYCIKPILLKEDKRLWYIVGVHIKHGTFITFALDRIEAVTHMDDEFEEVCFDVSEHFKYSFGITVTEEKPIEVKISFTPQQGNYLKTLPIHPSQKIIRDTADELLISVVVIPSYEFYSKIKSYGDQATIISPTSVKEKVLEELKRTLENYSN
ncbi:MAG: WYL domain-containing protein [Cyclobacteriaceae bacterium]